ncbi:MAG: hypothetical protein COV31_02530 [Candidatus Yanofskybacteria bacterium CG10_big_fil_rev_8_21_14_0_10_46_23]|uniref:Type 4 fimbrial biogenesis protein PilX N-terminal domain-containing protein n=1 Tax=Candidatus Yanofskybacteria bacterium CG10_big_fil_rev_8_21_14_0_10_46_23 TaxID=1975098 RepID=A0A2H0R415_9BACT|nr:MAG: hypothetical protein COV31_02530 [Candidatus Yanofskybacteria bacterium CG10_big_fil_rev_8_21_14_0_10_46_23]
MKKDNRQSGIALLLSLLFLGVILSIAFGLSAVFIPKIRLSVDARNSPTALFAADSGLEWCLYISEKGPIPTPLPPVFTTGATVVLTPTDCSGLTIKAVGTFNRVNRALEVNF